MAGTANPRHAPGRQQKARWHGDDREWNGRLAGGPRRAARVAVSLGEELGARLVAMHVLDRLDDVGPTAERVATSVLYDEAPDAQAEARGEVGDVAEPLAAVARDEGAHDRAWRRQSRPLRTSLGARSAAELAELTDVPLLVAPLSSRRIRRCRNSRH
jgi:hypothetical protein